MTQLTLPNEWLPRPHQLGVWNAMSNGIRRACLVWHRRAGKDSYSLNYLVTQAMTNKGVYWHMLPSNTQARKVMWLGIDYYGRRIIDQAIPPAIRKRTNDHEMMIELINGSIIMFVGSDNFDSLVGSNPKGIVFSEYSIANPQAWDFMRPILRENNGFAIFIYTSRGRNHGYRLYNQTKDNPEWYTELLTVDDTFREDGTPIITQADIEEERISGMSEEMIAQEYYCSWDGGMEGAFFAKEVMEINNNRFGSYPHDPTQPCLSTWDLGIRDSMAIGIFQRHPQTGHPILVDAIEDRNKGMNQYIKYLKESPFNFNYHFAPHDIEHRDLLTGKTRLELAEEYGMAFDVTPKLPLDEGIDILRNFLKVLHVNDTPATRHVLDMLGGYRREYDPKMGMFKDKPVHDFTSHSTDMMRYAAINWDADLLAGRFAVNRPKMKRVLS